MKYVKLNSKSPYVHGILILQGEQIVVKQYDLETLNHKGFVQVGTVASLVLSNAKFNAIRKTLKDGGCTHCGKPVDIEEAEYRQSFRWQKEAVFCNTCMKEARKSFVDMKAQLGEEVSDPAGIYPDYMKN